MAEDEYTTKPTLETLLERINALGDELRAFREEARAGFRNVERKIGVLSTDVLALRADVGDALERLDKLEVK